ncbi:MAG: SPOR domain-containing protein [Bacteroidales bacterium]|nr:SPOR domain-containing protein [Bacteroidales bacterium]
MKRLTSLFALLLLGLVLTAQNNEVQRVDTVVLENTLNTATNNQLSLAWYRGNLLFSSDRSSPRGSRRVGTPQLFFAQGIYDFEQGDIMYWNPTQRLRRVRSSDPDGAFAFDKNTQTYYVMRCPVPRRGRSQVCNIVAYRVDERGRMSRPAQQSFHDDHAIIGHPTLSSDGNVMFFTIGRDERTNLHMTRRTRENTWTTPVMLPAVINTNGVESFPQLFRDSLLFFASDGHPGMGGLDIFFTKIMLDGETHSVSGSSDLSRLEFSEPINLGAPINSGADDFAIVLQQDGNGGFFISNRAVAGESRKNIYRFNQEPQVFDQHGVFLARRMPARDVGSAVARQALSLLQEKIEEVSQLREDLDITREELRACFATANQIFHARTPASVEQATVAQPAPDPVVQAVQERVVYRVQVAASRTSDFRGRFNALYRAIPNLRMEIITHSPFDGYYRYVTVPFTTFEEADAIRRRIQALGFECFVSGYRGNQRVSMSIK